MYIYISTIKTKTTLCPHTKKAQICLDVGKNKNSPSREPKPYTQEAETSVQRAEYDEKKLGEELVGSTE